MEDKNYENYLNEYIFLLNSVESLVTGRTKKEEVVFSKNDNRERERLERSIPQPERRVNARAVETASAEPRGAQNSSEMYFNLTPATLKKEFLKCNECGLSEFNKILGKGSSFRPRVMIVTDTIPTDEELEYMEKILRSIHLNIENDAYFTSVVKCDFKGKAIPYDTYTKCSKFLKGQFRLYSPLAAIGFGKVASSVLTALKKKEEYRLCNFICTGSPNEIKGNNELKKVLWAELKKLALILNLPRV